MLYFIKYFLLICPSLQHCEIYLFRDSPYISKSFPEDHKNTSSSAAQSWCCTIKGSIACSKNNHGSLYWWQWRATAAYSWMMKGKPHFQGEKKLFLHDSSNDTCTRSSVKLHLAVSKHGESLSNYSASLRVLFPLLRYAHTCNFIVSTFSSIAFLSWQEIKYNALGKKKKKKLYSLVRLNATDSRLLCSKN